MTRSLQAEVAVMTGSGSGVGRGTAIVAAATFLACEKVGYMTGQTIGPTAAGTWAGPEATGPKFPRVLRRGER